MLRQATLGSRGYAPWLASGAPPSPGWLPRHGHRACLAGRQPQRRLFVTSGNPAADGGDASASDSPGGPEECGSDLESSTAEDGFEVQEHEQDDQEGPSLWELVRLEPGRADDWEDVEHDPESQDPELLKRKNRAPPRPHLWFSSHPEALLDELRQVFPTARHREWHGMVHSLGEGLRAPWEWFEQPPAGPPGSAAGAARPNGTPAGPQAPLGLREQLLAAAAADPWAPPGQRPPVVAFAQQYLPWCIRLPSLWPSRASLKQLAELLETALGAHVAAGGRWMLHVVTPSGPVFPAKSGHEATLRTDGRRKRYDRNPRAQFVRQLLATLRQREATTPQPGGLSGNNSGPANPGDPAEAAAQPTTSGVAPGSIADRDRLLSLTRVPCAMEARHWRRLRAREQAPVRAVETQNEHRNYLTGMVADEARAVRLGQDLVRLGFGASEPGAAMDALDHEQELEAKRYEAQARKRRLPPDSSEGTQGDYEPPPPPSAAPLLSQAFVADPPAPASSPGAGGASPRPPQEHPLPLAVVQLLFNEHLPQHTRRAAIRQARRSYAKQAKRLKVRRGGSTVGQLSGLGLHRQAVFVSIALPNQVQALERTGLAAIAGGRVNVPELKQAPSSAHTKLLEAEIRLGQRIRAGQLVADLGWNPGGWSFVALARRARVLAVDVSRHQEEARTKLVRTVGEELRALAEAPGWKRKARVRPGPTPQQLREEPAAGAHGAAASQHPPAQPSMPPPPMVQFLEADATRWMLGQTEEQAQPAVNPSQRRGSASSRRRKPASDAGVLTEQADLDDPHTPRVVTDLNPSEGSAGPKMVDWLCCDMIVSPEVSVRLLREWLRTRACRRFLFTLKFVGPGGAGTKRQAVEDAERVCESYRDVFVPGSPEWPETQRLMRVDGQPTAGGGGAQLQPQLEGLGRLRYWIRKLDNNGNEVTVAGTYVVDEGEPGENLRSRLKAYGKLAAGGANELVDTDAASQM